MKILVTGATGFIGSHLIDFLLARDAEIFALVRNPAKAVWGREKSVHLLLGDLSSFPALPSKIDIVFHLAGKTKALKSAHYYTVNQEGTASLFRSLLNSGAAPKVICLSSLAASGPSEGEKGVKESDPPRPLTPYGRSKLLGEEEALKYKGKLPVVIVRPCAIYGPQDRDFLDYFKWINKGILPTVRAKKLVSLCYVKDLVRALDQCARQDLPSGEILNIADPRPYTWEELGEAAGQALGKKLKRVRIPLGFVYLAASAAELVDRLRGEPGIFSRDKYMDLKQPAWIADVKKAAELLSFQPSYTLAVGLRETMAWYLDQGWL